VDDNEKVSAKTNLEQELLNPDKLFRTIVRIKKEALPLVPLWGAFLFKKAITSIVGDPGAGKTTFGYELGGSLCLGRPYLDIPSEEPVKMLFMDLESADSLVSSRSTLVFQDTEVPNFYVYNSPDFYLNQIFQVAVDFCKSKEINLIAIDNQTTAFATRDENDNAEAAKQMKIVRKFANMVNAAVILFHHTSKANLPGTRKGTGAFARARLADICLNVNVVDEEHKDIICLEMSKNRFDDTDKVLWYLKKEEGKFVRTDPPLGTYGEPKVNTMIYKASAEVINILKNGSKGELLKFQAVVAEMTLRGYNENQTDHAVRKLKQQNRIWSPQYGYVSIK